MEKPVLLSSVLQQRTSFSPAEAEFYTYAEALPVWQAAELFSSYLDTNVLTEPLCPNSREWLTLPLSGHVDPMSLPAGAASSGETGAWVLISSMWHLLVEPSTTLPFPSRPYSRAPMGLWDLVSGRTGWVGCFGNWNSGWQHHRTNL